MKQIYRSCPLKVRQNIILLIDRSISLVRDRSEPITLQLKLDFEFCDRPPSLVKFLQELLLHFSSLS